MRYALLLIGAVTTLIITLGLLGIPIEQLILGGALTSVFVGIAAQQSLSNVFAGMVLMLAHPFRIGDGIRLQAGALGGQVSGTIVEVGITYVRISTSTGVLSIPNSQVLNCIIGPLPESTEHDPQTPPPVMALPAVQPTPPAPPPMATRIVTNVRVPDDQPSDSRPATARPPAASPRSRPAPRNPARPAPPRNHPAFQRHDRCPAPLAALSDVTRGRGPHGQVGAMADPTSTIRMRRGERDRPKAEQAIVRDEGGTRDRWGCYGVFCLGSLTGTLWGSTRTRRGSMRGGSTMKLVRALVIASHPIPSLAVTAMATLLTAEAAPSGFGAGRVVGSAGGTGRTALRRLVQ